jgi:hypothetical protein
MKNDIIRDVTLCSLVEVYLRFGETILKRAVNTFLRIVGELM